MAGVALSNLHFGVFGVGHFFVGVGLLLQADKPKTKHCNDKYNFLHVCPPFLKVVVEGHAPGPVILESGIHVVLHPDGRRHIVPDLVLAAQPVFAGGFISGHFVPFVYVVMKPTGDLDLLGSLVSHFGDSTVETTAITITVVVIQGHVEMLDWSDAATDLEHIGFIRFKVLLAVAGIGRNFIVDSVIDSKHGFLITADSKHGENRGRIENRVTLVPLAGHYEVGSGKILDPGQHFAERFAREVKPRVAVYFERVEQVLFEGRPYLVAGNPVLVELHEIAELGIGVPVSRAVSGYPEGKVLGTGSLAIKVEDDVAATHNRKGHRTDIFQFDLAAVDQSAARRIIDKLATQPDIHLIKQVGIIPVKIIEPAVRILAVA